MAVTATELGSLKWGNTMAFTIDLADDGVPIAGAASNLQSQVRTESDTLLAELIITESSTIPGRYTFQAASSVSTETWRGIVYLDIKYTDSGISKSSDTLSIKMIKSVTHDE